MVKEPAENDELPNISPLGDRAVNVEFGSDIDEAVNDRVYQLADALNSASPDWLQELVPTYRSLVVYYDAYAHDTGRVIDAVREIAAGVAGDADDTPRHPLVYELPTLYGGEHGPDIESVAEHAGLSVPEVVKIHSGAAYRVYMIGFSPGFPYLGGMNQQIATPRLSTPRTRVPAGSVGIAESQTGVYPTASPGGWQLIGRTPVRLFEQDRDPPSVLQPGHFVRFVPIESAEFDEIERDIAAGRFEISVAELEL